MRQQKLRWNPSREYIDRAYAMADLLRNGWSYREIAAEYGVSRSTVNTALCALRTLDPAVFRRCRTDGIPDNRFLARATAAVRNPRLAARNKEWCDRIENGDSLADIAADWNTTPLTVRIGASSHRKAHNYHLNQARGVA